MAEFETKVEGESALTRHLLKRGTLEDLRAFIKRSDDGNARWERTGEAAKGRPQRELEDLAIFSDFIEKVSKYDVVLGDLIKALGNSALRFGVLEHPKDSDGDALSMIGNSFERLLQDASVSTLNAFPGSSESGLRRVGDGIRGVALVLLGAGLRLWRDSSGLNQVPGIPILAIEPAGLHNAVKERCVRVWREVAKVASEESPELRGIEAEEDPLRLDLLREGHRQATVEGGVGKGSQIPVDDHCFELTRLIMSVQKNRDASADPTAPRELGNAARGLSVLPLSSAGDPADHVGTLVAVSWARKGQEAYLLRAGESQPTRCWTSRPLQDVETFRPSHGTVDAGGEDLDGSFSRAVKLFRYEAADDVDASQSELLLLTFSVPSNEESLESPAMEPIEERVVLRTAGTERDYLSTVLDPEEIPWVLPFDKLGLSVERHVYTPADSPTKGAEPSDSGVSSPTPEESETANESVFSLLELEQGLFLLGLRGTAGYARLGLLLLPKVIPLQDGGDPAILYVLNHDLSGLGEVRSRGPLASGAGRKRPVRALCSLRDGPVVQTTDAHRVLTGSDDGVVAQVLVPSAARLRDEGLGALSEFQSRVVGRTLAPIFALATRNRPLMGTDEASRPYSLSRRVYVSSANSVIECWGFDDDSREPWLVPARPEKPLRIWVTHGVDITVDFLPLSPGERDGEADGVVDEHQIAVNQDGIALLISDDSELRPNSVEHSRPRPPGSRMGEIRLYGNSTLFVSGLLPGGAAVGRSDSLCQLIIGTGDKQLVRAAIPADALHAGLRQKLDRSYELLGDGRAQSSMFSLLRGGDATILEAPEYARLLVRWVFEEAEDQKILARDIDRFEFPRWLRPLRDLAALMHARQSGQLGDGQSTGLVSDLLHLALMRIHRMGEVSVFTEVLVVIFRWTNRALGRAANRLSSDDDPNLPAILGAVSISAEVIREIRRIEHLHAGRNDHSRVLQAIVENLLDGDTFWALVQIDGEHAPSFREVLEARAAVIQQLLLRSASWIPEETLRASNRALIQVAKRVREQLAGGSGDEEEDALSPKGLGAAPIDWSCLEAYYAAVRERVAVATRQELRAKTVLQHEISRTFALGCLISPDRAVALTTMAMESEEPDVYGQLGPQIMVLTGLGLDRVVDQRWLSHRLIELVEFVLGVGRGAGDHAALTADLGSLDTESNRSLLDQIVAARTTRDWVLDLARMIRQGISTLDLKRSLDQLQAEVQSTLQGQLQKRQPLGVHEGDYRHSMDFWSRFLGDLHVAFCHLGSRAERQPVRPEEVLAIQHLARVCGTYIDELESGQSARRMREPFRSDYRTALVDLRDSAVGFAGGPELQQNLVEGILGHGILERLDEQAMELNALSWELHPPLLWGRPRGETSVGLDDSGQAEIGEYLERSADAVETIPKTLRNLEKVLKRSTQEPSGVGESRTPGEPEEARREDGLEWAVHSHLRKVLKAEAKAADTAPDPMAVSGRDIRQLDLTRQSPGDAGCKVRSAIAVFAEAEKPRIDLSLSELFQNHRVHFDPESDERPPIDSIDYLIAPTVSELTEYLSLPDGQNLASLEERSSDHGRLKSAIRSSRRWRAGEEYPLPHPSASEAELENDEVLFGIALRFTSHQVSGPERDSDRIRVEELFRAGFEEPFNPRPGPHVPSYGTGLYLANLSASSCGWRLCGWLLDVPATPEHSSFSTRTSGASLMRLGFFLFRTKQAPMSNTQYRCTDMGGSTDAQAETA